MKANELRIGNWVMFGEDVFPEQVTLESFVILMRFPERESWIIPIPLTPEILEKTNLKFIYSAASLGSYAEFCQADNGKYYLMFEGVINDEEVPIEYVHQFQNLYFALTGEELEVKF